MIEILPNWHPIFVHFTVALYSTAFLLFAAAVLFPGRAWTGNCRTAAHWNLWLGAAFTVATLAAGLYAYGTVRHDEPSHVAMTGHRNWALATAALWWGIAAWAAVRHRRGRGATWPFVGALAAAAALLGVTAWKGGELVYRYGLGVLSLPAVEKETGEPAAPGHDHPD